MQEMPAGWLLAKAQAHCFKLQKQSAMREKERLKFRKQKGSRPVCCWLETQSFRLMNKLRARSRCLKFRRERKPNRHPPQHIMHRRCVSGRRQQQQMHLNKQTEIYICLYRRG